MALDPAAQQPLLNLANSLGDLYRSKEARVSNQVVVKCVVRYIMYTTLMKPVSNQVVVKCVVRYIM